MSKYILKADECRHDLTPRCPSGRVRFRMGEPTAEGMDLPSFDPRIIPELDKICDDCEMFEAKEL